MAIVKRFILISKRYMDSMKFPLPFHIFLSGKVPYAALGGQEIVKLLKTGERLPKPEGCSDEM